jgi:hypothetical protein
MDFNALLSKIGLSADLTQDITLILVMAAASVVFGLFIGRFRLITILINIYVALAIVSATPDKYFKDYSYEIGFFALLVVVFTFLGKSLFEIHISGAGSGYLWRVFVMSFIEVAMLISIILSLMPKAAALGYVSQTAYGYLASPGARFIWMTLPIVFILFIHKRLNR